MVKRQYQGLDKVYQINKKDYLKKMADKNKKTT